MVNGKWKSSNKSEGFHGDDYIHDCNKNKGKCSVQYKMPQGHFEVTMKFPGNILQIQYHSQINISVNVFSRQANSTTHNFGFPCPLFSTISCQKSFIFDCIIIKNFLFISRVHEYYRNDFALKTIQKVFL